MIWLGETRGYFSDWVTQRWVQATGRRVDLATKPWLRGPIGQPHGVGANYFTDLAAREGLAFSHAGERGLVTDLSQLDAPDFDHREVAPAVADFYARTSEFCLDSWAEWSGPFRAFGWILASIFSRRLEQLNVPLSSLDTSHGVTSDVIHLVDPATGTLRHTAWVRQLVGSGNVLYAGSYSVATLPGRIGACIKVVFPLPNGNGIVFMRPEAHSDGSLSVVSAGQRFGDPGFYFTVYGSAGRVWARYLPSLRERIHVYPAEGVAVRADHVLSLFGATFLRLHYRLQPDVPAFVGAVP